MRVPLETLSICKHVLSVLFAGLFYANVVFAESEQQVLDEGLVNPGFHEQPVWFKNSFLDMREDIAEAQQAGKRLILYFFQDGCPYCKRLLEVNFTQKAIVDKTRKHFEVVSLNMWGDREVITFDGRANTEKLFAEKLRVMFTPTLLFLNERGEVVLRVNGLYPPKKFMTALDYVAGHHETAMDFRRYQATHAPPPVTGQLHQSPFLMAPPLNLARLKSQEKPLVVLFEQKKCIACDELHLDVLKRSETLTLLKQINVAQVDIWSQDKMTLFDGKTLDAQQWAKQLDIKYTPSLVFFDTQGMEVFRMEAYLKAFHVQSSLDYVIAAAYLKEPSFQRYIDKRAKALRDRGVEINLME